MLDSVKALETLKQMVDKPIINYWDRLKDSAGSMDVAQVTYVMSQDSVKEAYRVMMESFNNFLFEKFKEDFSTIPAYQPCVETYVDTVIQTAQSYGKHTQELEEENKRLKQQLEEALNVDRHQAD
jgi:hypothetical protein